MTPQPLVRYHESSISAADIRDMGDYLFIHFYYMVFFYGFFYVLNYFDQTKFTIPNLTLQNPDGVSVKDRERSQQHGCHGAA